MVTLEVETYTLHIICKIEQNVSLLQMPSKQNTEAIGNAILKNEGCTLVCRCFCLFVCFLAYFSSKEFQRLKATSTFWYSERIRSVHVDACTHRL